MPSRNSYSEVMLGRPSSMMTALAVVPPMSNTMRSGSPRAAPSRAAPITPPAGPEATTNTGFSQARWRGEHAAVGGDDPDRRGDADGAQAGLEVAQVARMAASR